MESRVSPYNDLGQGSGMAGRGDPLRCDHAGRGADAGRRVFPRGEDRAGREIGREPAFPRSRWPTRKVEGRPNGGRKNLPVEACRQEGIDDPGGSRRLAGRRPGGHRLRGGDHPFLFPHIEVHSGHGFIACPIQRSIRRIREVVDFMKEKGARDHQYQPAGCDPHGGESSFSGW